jgi:hypothetical protein
MTEPRCCLPRGGPYSLPVSDDAESVELNRACGGCRRRTSCRRVSPCMCGVWARATMIWERPSRATCRCRHRTLGENRASPNVPRRRRSPRHHRNVLLMLMLLWPTATTTTSRHARDFFSTGGMHSVVTTDPASSPPFRT